jgi:hypothetical protein
MQKATRKRRSKADVSISKKLKLYPSLSSESVSFNESDLILKKYQDAAHDCSVDSSATSVWLALNVVLDNTTFEKTLLQHDISFQHEENIAPLITRAYEEQFMRECICEEFPHDKPCRSRLNSAEDKHFRRRRP